MRLPCQPTLCLCHLLQLPAVLILEPWSFPCCCPCVPFHPICPLAKSAHESVPMAGPHGFLQGDGSGCRGGGWGQQAGEGPCIGSGWGRESRTFQTFRLCAEKPSASTKSSPLRQAGQLQLHRLAEQKENRGPEHQIREKWFSCGAKVFVLSKHKGLLMGKEIFELLEDALGGKLG